MDADLLITAPHVVTSAQVHSPGWVAVDHGMITAVGGPTLPSDEGAPAVSPFPRGQNDGHAGEARPARQRQVVELSGTVVPGFVDIHCHGGGGASMTEVQHDPDVVRRAVATHLEHGVTTVMASLVSADATTLLAQTRALADLAEAGVIAGVHLEGPWISALHRGAHALSALRMPTEEEIDSLLEGARGHLRMVTLAPELEGALDAVSRLVGAGVVAALGHTNADTAAMQAGFDAGASVATHVFNAMRPVHHREPGPVVTSLVDERVTVELILDGHHVAWPACDLVRRGAGERLVLVSDAMAAAGAQDGDYRLGDQLVQVRRGVARLADVGSLAGSTLTLDVAFAQLVTGLGASLSQAVTAACTRPAQALGLAGPGGVGDLAPGLRADLVVLDHQLAVTGVLRGGEWVRRPA